MNSKVCPACGKPNDPKLTRCTACDASFLVVNCPACAAPHTWGVKKCYKCKTELPTPIKKATCPLSQYISETKGTCKACGNIWFYGKGDVAKSKLDALKNCDDATKKCLCCCYPSKERTIVDFDRCPKCGSTDITSEMITHEVA